MSKLNRRTNFRVEVRPRSPGDFGFASISGIEQSEREWERDCEAIAEQIRRHVDGLSSSWRGSDRGVTVEWDNEPVCSHCGSTWTEDHDRHNGGCCDEDCKIHDAEEANRLEAAE